MSNTYWYGYLEAGAKSSFVARDMHLDTGNVNTIYLFNLTRGEFKEYRLDIVEPKLRELSAQEIKKQKKALEKAFKTALASFKGRTSSSTPIPEKSSPPANTTKKKIPEEEIVSDIDSFDDADDNDWDEDN